jgi:4-hydroxy-2-oxoheptanedioate aldolase
MTLRDQLDGTDPVVGTIQIYDSPMVTETLAKEGMDFVVFDQEHGPLSAETTQTCCMAAENAGASPIVRVRTLSEPEIQRGLDIGAGIQVPQVETRDEAEAAIGAARYPPHGSRGLSQYVRAGGYTGQADYAARQNEEATVILQVEGERGLGNLDAILSVDGYDGIFLGPYDISSSLGIPGQVRDERVESAMAEACEQAAAAGIAVGTFADDPAMANRWIDAGVDFVELGVEAALFGAAISDAVGAVEGP